MAAMGDKAKTLVASIEELSHVMLKITGYVMMVAPVAVFAALAATVASQGLGILATYGKFIGGFYASLLLLWQADAYSGRQGPISHLGKQCGQRCDCCSFLCDQRIELRKCCCRFCHYGNLSGLCCCLFGYCCGQLCDCRCCLRRYGLQVHRPRLCQPHSPC